MKRASSLSMSEINFIKSNYKNSTPKDIFLAINRLRIASKKKAIGYPTFYKCYDIFRSLNEASSKIVQQKVHRAGKGRPSSKSIIQAVDNLYGECSEIDDLLPEYSILDDDPIVAKLPEGKPQQPPTVNQVETETDSK